MKHIVTILILTATAALVHAQEIAGEWQGTLKAGIAELRLVLHINKDTSGGLTATLDSLDQGALGIPVKTVSLKNSRLTFDVAAVQGTYEGTVAADGKTISGTWSQGTSLPLEFKRATTPIKTHKPAKATDIDGAWEGTLDTGGGALRLVFHITNTEDGLIAMMDSPDQGAKGIPASSVTRNGKALKIEAKGIGGTFEGQISENLSAIDGRWSQGEITLPLMLKRAKP